jgi:hypothetical protein
MGGPFLHNLPQGATLVSPALYAEEKMAAKWEWLRGSPGEPLFAGRDGLIEMPKGFRRDYRRGAMYCRNFGEPYFLDLATHQRYDQLGGPRGFLGYPVSDFVPDGAEPGSGVTRFDNGAIYFWPDVGAIEMQEISLRYVGFHCFGETDGFAGADEVYFTFGVVPTLVEQKNTLQTRIISDVDTGDSHSEFVPMELYRGMPLGAAVSVTLVEADEGDPNKYRPIVAKGVDKGSEKVVAALGETPVIGWLLGPLASLVFVVAAPALTDLINDLLGTADDHIGTVAVPVTPKDMMRLTRVGRRDFEGVKAHLESPLISGLGGSYKAYFDIELV